MSKIIAVDLGGTYLRTALVKNNKILKYIKKKTPKNKEALLREMTENIESLMTEDVKAIGVGSPGPLVDGIIKNPPNLPFRNFNLKKYLQDKFHKGVVVENDAKCVALAEAKLGCKKRNFIILTLGTGIGGGIIINRELYKGEGMGGELGHIILDNRKDFEDLWKEHRELSKRYFGKTLLIRDLLNEKDKKAGRIVENTAKVLGQGIGSLINIFDPEIVVLSGGVKETGRKFLKMIRKQAQNYTIIPRKTKIKWTKLKHPGILGASLLVR